MSSSASETIPYVVEYVRKNRPNLSTVLDIGIGFGKDGFLLRDFFDAKEWYKFQPKEWKLKITGVEIFEKYISELQRMLYNKIIIGDILAVLPKLGKFDLAILNDVLEHFPKETGFELINKLFEHVEDIIITTHKGFYEHSSTGGNVNEEHKSGWILDDYKQFNIIDSAVVKRIRKPEELLVVYLRR